MLPSCSQLFCTLLVTILPMTARVGVVSGFVTHALMTTTTSSSSSSHKNNKAFSLDSSTLLRDSENDDSGHAAVPLPLTASDMRRLTMIQSRHKTIPLMIMDAMVPGQTISFESADPKFHNLVRHVLSEGTEIGMIGLNPHTGRPLNIGVTLPVTPKNVHLDEKTQVVTLNVQAKRRFEVQGEPWLYRTDHRKSNKKNKNKNNSDDSFYLADVEIVDDRPEDPLPDHIAVMVQNLSDQVPTLVATWVHHLVQRNIVSALNMEARMLELGPLPSDWKERAHWIAALLNPTTSQTAGEERVCLEIRPAMLACKNDHDRMVLATAALQSSIDHVSGEKKLF